MNNSFFIGLDLGGTSSSAVMVDRVGSLVAGERGPGFNALAAGPGPEGPARIGELLRRVVANAPPAATVEAVVMGVAGLAARPDVAERLAAEVSAVGLACRVEIVHDTVTMLATGVSGRTGSVLSVGTGAVGASIRDGRVVRLADGAGWLLGDVGSATWLGIEAIKAVIRGCDGRGRNTALTRPVLSDLGVKEHDATDGATSRSVVRAAHALAASELGRLAPLVDRAAVDGDPVAIDIIDRAASGLLTTLGAVVGGPTEPIVLGGVPLHASTTLGPRVREGVVSRWPRADIHTVVGGLGGAALIGLRMAGNQPDEHVRSRVIESAHKVSS